MLCAIQDPRPKVSLFHYFFVFIVRCSHSIDVCVMRAQCTYAVMMTLCRPTVNNETTIKIYCANYSLKRQQKQLRPSVWYIHIHPFSHVRSFGVCTVYLWSSGLPLNEWRICNVFHSSLVWSARLPALPFRVHVSISFLDTQNDSNEFVAFYFFRISCLAVVATASVCVCAAIVIVYFVFFIFFVIAIARRALPIIL